MAVCDGKTIHQKDSKWSWLVCLCATLSNALHMGIANSFAVLMPILLSEFDETKERAGWLGSISVTLTFLPTPLAGIFCGRFGCRITSLIGALTCAAGLALTSFAKSLLVMYFTYSLMFGLGACFIHTACVFAVTMYFDKRRSLATGIVGASQSIGIITIAPSLPILLKAVAWRNCYRVLAGLFGIVVLGALAFDSNVESTTAHVVEKGPSDARKKKKEQPKFSCEMFKRPSYILAVICVTLGCFGTLVTFIHLVKYCEEMGVSPQNAANLFIFIGISSLISSVVSGRVLDMNGVSPFHVNQFANFVLACCQLLLPQASTYTHFIIFVVFFGIGFGCFITTIYLMLLNTVEPRLQFYSFPVGETIISVGTIGGAPFAGFIADVTGSYVPAFYTFGGVLMFAVLLAFPVYFFGLHRTPRDPDDRVEPDLEISLEETKEKKQENGHARMANDVVKLEVVMNENQNVNGTRTNVGETSTNDEQRAAENGHANIAFDDAEELDVTRDVFKKEYDLSATVISVDNNSQSCSGDEKENELTQAVASGNDNMTTKF